MRQKKLVLLIAAGFLAYLAGPAWATYESIQSNLSDGIPDTVFDVNTGKFSISQASNAITLNDPTQLGGTITDGFVDMKTWLSSYDSSTGVAKFTGGSFLLTFDYDGTPHQISGPITAMEFQTNVYSSTYSTIDGEGLWKATTKNLPGSGDWPDGGGASSIKSLSLVFGCDLSTWEWNSSLTNCSESLYTLWPDDSAVPEPTSLLLIGLGTLLLYRRRA